MLDCDISLCLTCCQVGERLGKYEVEKRQAVESEDYDKAKLKKVQMDEYRLQMYKDLGIHELLQVLLHILAGVSRGPMLVIADERCLSVEC